jgi:16S rRNA (adenine1518-N6/adenine1519-N6)-dimethyltransferase
LIKAKKSLGQNFLTDRDILEKITRIVPIQNKHILEIGPGTGNLTSFILKNNPKEMFVIEKDDVLAKNLDKIFNKQIKIINDDVLNVDETLLFQEKIKVTVFGNLPYNISTEILSKWIINLKENSWFDYLILMFQKEVADRIIAKSNSSAYGRLSILSHWKLNIKKICDIKPESFSPKPKIDSSLLLFTPKEKFFKIKDPKNLEKVTRIFFNQRRKMLKKPFNQLFNGDQKVIEKLKINLNLRPQNLDFDTYYQLTSLYENLRN